MFAMDFLFAFITALLLAAVFAFLFRRTGSWPFLLFFIIIFLGSWAGGIWLAPVPVVTWNIYALRFLVVGVLVALMLSLFIFPRPYRIRMRRPRESETGDEPVLILSIFFWILIILLIITIIINYI